MSQDPVLVCGVAGSGLTAGWLVVATAPELTAARISWAVSSASLATVAWLCRRAMVRKGLDGSARRLCRYLAWSATTCLAAVAAQLTEARDGTDIVYGTPAGLLVGLGVLLALVGLLGYPLPTVPRSTFWRVQLDAGTVAVATGLCWNAIRDRWPPPSGSGWPAALELAALMASVFALNRIASTRRQPRQEAAGLLTLLSCIAIAVAGGQARPWVAAGHAGWYLALHVVASGMILTGARVALREPGPGPDRARPAEGPQRSRLPYAALALSFVVLAAVQLGHGQGPGTGLVTVAGAAIATAFVVLRHRAALSENERLLGRLTRTLAERDDLERMLQRMAFEDPLTGVANRARFSDDLARAQSEAARMDTSVALLLIDLDDFKPVNDRYGHAAGDAVLRVCAERMAACLGPGDLLARIGGDEFAVVLRQSYKLAATALAELIVGELRRPIAVNGTITVTIGASVGVAAATGGRRTPEALLRDADAAMYDAKDRGKGTVSIS